MKTIKDTEIKIEDIERIANRLAELLQDKFAIQSQQWINEQEVMDMTGLKSKGAILKLRQQGKIKYTQPYKRIIMYDKKSILDFLKNHVRETF
jgi:hypothetical protein